MSLPSSYRRVGERGDIKLAETGADIAAPAHQQWYSDTALPPPGTSPIIATAKCHAQTIALQQRAPASLSPAAGAVSCPLPHRPGHSPMPRSHTPLVCKGSTPFRMVSCGRYIPSTGVLLQYCRGWELDVTERWRDFPSCRPGVVSARPDWKNTQALKCLFYPSLEFMGDSSCPQYLMWHLYLFLKITNEIIKTEMWHNCVAAEMHEQINTPCRATLQSSLRRLTGLESCCMRPIFLHDLSFRAQRSRLITHGRRSNTQN